MEVNISRPEKEKNGAQMSRGKPRQRGGAA